MNQEKTPNQKNKSDVAKREEETLAYWNDSHIFEKTLEKTEKSDSFVFYDGPPFATGLPHYGHLLQGTVKDAIPRYQTMKGKYVRRQWGWDCHGLPIENLIEDELGFKTKQDIEDYGIENFNTAACNSVLTYDKDWKEIVPRTGRFVDMEHGYKTMDWQYSESIMWAFKQLYDKDLIYKGYKSMHICPRCETTLSNNEVADGYKDIKDLSVTAKFELVDEPGTFVLAWTTTPWTLPGNVALAVGEDVEYVQVKTEDGQYIVAKERSEEVMMGVPFEVAKTYKGTELVGKSYKPLFDYYAKNTTLENHQNGWKIYAADFVTTTDGTGVVHIAPAFGEDDMNLGKEKNLPFVQHVKMNGHFKAEVTDFSDMHVKSKDDKETGADHMSTDIEIVKYLAGKGTLFSKLKYEHSYPHCWRCKTPLLNYAADSWFVKVTDPRIKDVMVEENKKVVWVPENIGRARFGNWIENARDWAISRSRYWGAPLPVWTCDTCEDVFVAGGINDLKEKTKSTNTYHMIRHGEADSNVQKIISSKVDNPHHLTERGMEQVKESAQELKDAKIDTIIASPFVRTKETAELIAAELGIPKSEIIFDERIKEADFGLYDGKPEGEYHACFVTEEEKFNKKCEGGEDLVDVKKRVGDFLYDIDRKYEGKNILIVSHDYPSWLLQSVVLGLDIAHSAKMKGEMYLKNAEVRKLDFAPIPHNRNYEVDVHRPYIDEVTFPCACGGTMKRIPEVFDCWFESGSMPYAQFHYPFENKDEFEKKSFPADFIAEGLDQTRGWFYTLLVLGAGIFGKSPYQHVIVTGTVLAEDGQKMSKSLRNYPDPMELVDQYGADALRYYLLTSPLMRAGDLNFSEKGVAEVSRKVGARLLNVLSFYEMYADRKQKDADALTSDNVLDKWIIARLVELEKEVSEGYETYQLDKATRPLGDFVDDLSTWYLRRSRSRFKDDDVEDRDYALATTQFVLKKFSKILAPTMPFVSDYVYKKVGGVEESVHLAAWPELQVVDTQVLEDMAEVRNIVSVALEARASAGIKVRQPLRSLSVKSDVLKGKDTLLEVIADEVNVKEVVVDATIEGMVALNTVLTPELISEGQFREFVRNVQELRKNTGLTPDDMVVARIEVKGEAKVLIGQFEDELKKTSLIKEVVYEEVEGGEEIKVDDLEFKVLLEK